MVTKIEVAMHTKVYKSVGFGLATWKGSYLEECD